MRSILITYPGFHGLPKSVKKMVLVSESFFFGEARPQGERDALDPSSMPAGVIRVAGSTPPFSALPGVWAPFVLGTGGADAPAGPGP